MEHSTAHTDERSSASIAAAALASSEDSAAQAGSDANNRAPSRSRAKGVLPPIPRATSIIIIGMAGSGKSTFAAKLANHVGPSAVAAAARQTAAGAAGESKGKGRAESMEQDEEQQQRPRPYCVNLDPAVAGLGYEPNVDIRDTVDYAKVMKDYNLGPNGGILTALNLFTTKFDQVLGIVEKRAEEVDEVILDTPGQIEIFTWSASGSIITDALGSAMPTCVAYIIDTPRTIAPATFMSNMLYACSIMYKSKLPFILVFNKTDLQPHDFALEWMGDFEAFQRDLKSGNATDPVPALLARSKGGNLKVGPSTLDPNAEGSYMNSLMNSMALVLDEFYTNLKTVGVSSTTGEGIDDFLRAVQEARQEYLTDYRPELERLAAQKEARAERDKQRNIDRFMRDMALSNDGSGAKSGGGRFGDDKWPEDEEEDAAELAAAAKGRQGLTMEERRRKYELSHRSAGGARGKQKAGAEDGDDDDDEIIEKTYDGDGLILDPDPMSDEEDKKEEKAFQRMLDNNTEKRFGLGNDPMSADGTKWPPVA
ncbi:hypothetical protein OC846_005652 [Tilletia horrida]|uniref:GPN-loop GTPase 1 n=1 Tax=Tilletia horrida TaxID=155126 RepID=A0AAN6GMK6_9BASI|nr:hypothetical protein OC846_005652 [Tilletia horrida]KAK0562727.1 hypothetical protein OC861_005170 [Tilletia horrida]